MKRVFEPVLRRTAYLVYMDGRYVELAVSPLRPTNRRSAAASAASAGR